jgi:serine O-acetyltransferase
MKLLRTILTDLRRKAVWCYESDRWTALLKVLLTDGTFAMILYRLMQWSHRCRLWPLTMLFNKLNAFCCNCIIGRGADFGPGFVLIHATGVVINGNVRGGSNVYIEHQVTIGAERRQTPLIGSDVFIGAGAKILGEITVGDFSRVGANAVVVHDVPAHSTVVGIPARVVRTRGSAVPPPDDAPRAKERRPVGHTVGPDTSVLMGK